MGIHWYPGHMHKATKEMKSILSSIDAILEITDARMPYSSSNPVIDKLSNDKPFVKVLNKIDLADRNTTELWKKYYLNQGVNEVIEVSATQDLSTIKSLHTTLLGLCPKARDSKNINVMIVGVPNTGKSTIINAISGKKAAATGDEPAVTKAQKRIKCSSGLVLHDTPGILWPKIHNVPSTYRLAVLGSIKNTVTEYDDLAFYIYEYLSSIYSDELMNRFKLNELPLAAADFFNIIGKKRGCLVKGGKIDLHRISEIFITELREGLIGKMTLETPEIIEKELSNID
jgi:ribosome biogenesis GTPase A